MPTRIKGGPLLSRLAYVRGEKGEEGVQSVLARLPIADRQTCGQLLTGGWYPFELNERLDQAVAEEMGLGQQVFIRIGEKSAEQNLGGAHKAMLAPGDPHGLLRRTPQIYQMYYDTGRRTYEQTGERMAILRTFEAETVTPNDCLTVVGWHRKAIELCGGAKPRVTETKCRAKGADVCEYVCEWS
jgi:uncharacterized protein (TIGR02265 family)